MKNTVPKAHRYLSISVNTFDSYRDIDRHRQISTVQTIKTQLKELKDIP